MQPEVLPHRAGDREACAVRPSEHIHHVGDHGGDDLNVVGRHVGRSAQAVGGAEIRDAEPQGQHPVAVFVDGPGDALKGLGAALQMQQLRRFQHRHREEPAGAVGLGRGQRLKERDATFLGEFRKYKSRQSVDGASHAAHQVRYLTGGADADEQQRQAGAGGGRLVEETELPYEVLLAGLDIPVSYGVLKTQHHGQHATPGLLEDVGGEARAGGGAVERGPQSDRERASRRIGGELHRLLVEQCLPSLGREMPKMLHITPRLPAGPGHPRCVSLSGSSR